MTKYENYLAKIEKARVLALAYAEKIEKEKDEKKRLALENNMLFFLRARRGYKKKLLSMTIREGKEII